MQSDKKYTLFSITFLEVKNDQKEHPAKYDYMMNE